GPICAPQPLPAVPSGRSPGSGSRHRHLAHRVPVRRQSAFSFDLTTLRPHTFPGALHIDAAHRCAPRVMPEAHRGIPTLRMVLVVCGNKPAEGCIGTDGEGV